MGVKHDGGAPVQLFNLKDDPSESRDVAADHPAVVMRVAQVMRSARTKSPIWPLAGVD